MQNNLGIPPRFHLFFFNFKSSALKKSKMKTKKKTQLVGCLWFSARSTSALSCQDGPPIMSKPLYIDACARGREEWIPPADDGNDSIF